ncbi:MAG TPA: 50S ribosomal protein L18 [Patescibacteria group bacterium]
MAKINRNKSRLQRKRRISGKIKLQSKNPRLAVFKSLKGIYAQLIDDSKGVTLLSATTTEAKVKNNIEGAKKVGMLVAKKCLDRKIKAVVFDRAGYKYHGKVRALADGAREAGLKL